MKSPETPEVPETSKTPLVSIVIPVLNQSHFTKLCLETLLSDEARPTYQIIVIDNASTDDTGKVLDSFQEKIETIPSVTLKVIRNETNKGVAPAWNQGVQAATGEYVGILNNDLLLTSGWMRGCIWAINQYNLGAVSPFAGTGKLTYDLEDKYKRFTFKNETGIWYDFDFCCIVFRRNTLQTLGLFDENYLVGGYEDTDYAHRMRANNIRYGVTGASYIHHFGSQTLGEFKKTGDKHVTHNRNHFISKWGYDPSRYKAARKSARSLLEEILLKANEQLTKLGLRVQRSWRKVQIKLEVM